MLGVLPFVEDPDLSCSAAAALPQQQKRIVCWFFGFHICTTYYSLAAENNTLLGLNRTGTKYLCQNRIPYSCLSNSDSSTASTGYLTDSNFHFLNKSAQEKNPPSHFPDSCNRCASISGGQRQKQDIPSSQKYLVSFLFNPFRNTPIHLYMNIFI